jgi:DNA repair exonuclease SbcCD ATPase subunit
MSNEYDGFPTVEQYKKGIGEVQAKIEKFKTEEKLEKDKLKLSMEEFKQMKTELDKVKEEIDKREKQLAEREKICEQREKALKDALQMESNKLAIYNSDVEVIRRNYPFVLNRLTRIANQMTADNNTYGNILSQNIKLLDGMKGSDYPHFLMGFDRLLNELKIVINDTYDTVVIAIQASKPTDTSLMVKCFKELSENESFRLLRPMKWIEN